MPKLLRLSKKEIEEVISKGRRASFSSFSVSYIKTSEKKTKFAFVVSKKQYKKAVFRNKAKRRLRDLVRKTEFSEGNYVFFAKNNINQELFSKLKEEVIKTSKYF